MKYDMSRWTILTIQEFLMGRTFSIQVQDAFSMQRNIKAGVPQGSVLGPILFNIYLADLEVPAPAKIALFADDAAIYTQDYRLGVARANMQKSVEHWRITLNPHKTTAVTFSRSRNKKKSRGG